jgi:hypothetical protein
MVQEFFNSTEVQNSGLNFIGFTYGAPGTNKKFFHSIITETFHSFKKALKVKKFSAFKKLAICLLSNIFYKIGINFTEIISSEVNAINKNIDKRIFQYEHAGDLIPKIGAAAYNEIGEEIYLKDVASINAKETFMLTGVEEKKQKHKFFSFISNKFNILIKKPIQIVKNMFYFEYHDMLRYVINLEHKISTEHNKEHIPYYSKFLEYKKRFNKYTTNIHKDLIYQRLLEKNIIFQNNIEQKNFSSSIPQNKIEQKRVSVCIPIPKEIKDIIDKLHYFQTTKNVVSDILGKSINYNIKKITLSGTDKIIETSIPQMPINIADITKQFNKKLEQPHSIIFKKSLENIYTLRKKFLNNSKNKNNNLII